MTTRRKIVVAIGLAALAGPLAAFAQQKGKVWRIGFVYGGSRQSCLDSGRCGAFAQGMREFGYVEGRDYVLEGAFADSDYKRIPGMVDGLLRSGVDVIISTGIPFSQVVKRATRTTPVVVTTSFDPVREGLAASLGRPGGNFTGIATLIGDLFAKQVQLLGAAVPDLSDLAVLANPHNAGHPFLLEDVKAAARKLVIRVHRSTAGTPEEIDRAFAEIAKSPAKAVVVLGDPLFVVQFRRIAQLAIRYRLPSSYTDTAYAESGGFMSYGPSFTDNYRKAAKFVDKIFRGAKPGDIPFEQPTKLELVLNMKTAKAIGMKIPRSVLLRADRVIE
jgi:putative ABC transport system substrate-binding protein